MFVPIGSSSTLFRLESSLVSDIVAARGPLLLLIFMLLLMGPRDVISGDDATEPLCDFLEPLEVFELDRPIC